MVADIPHPRTSLGGAVSSLLRPRSGAGGVCPPRVPPTHPLPKNGKLDEKNRKNRVMTKKVLLYLEALRVDPSPSRTVPRSEKNDPADPFLDTWMRQQS